MEEKYTPMMLVTANVGSIFEDPQTLLKIWVKEFLSTVKHLQPKFLALHCQEVGGKNYEESMRHVEDFVRMLMASEELLNFGQVRVYLDEDFTCTEKFTALGNLYFVHNSIKNAQIWDFKENSFVPVEGKEVHSGNIERVTTKEKAKFPQEFFPECKWSRKGFMRTRWSISGTIFDLINIHLFHDASNFVAMESFPSAYTKNRQHALEYTLHRFQTDEYEKIPLFIFGDFNFRLDTPGVVQRLTNRATPIHIKSAKNGEIVKVLYRDPVNENKVVLTLEKKVFDFENHEEMFLRNRGKWLQEYDKELQMFQEQLFEFDIDFPPSYPFEEDAGCGTTYMRTRCPSWCDRILLSKSARSLVHMTPADGSTTPPVLYQLIGSSVAMGDHKPVLLWFRLLPPSGRQISYSPSQNPVPKLWFSKPLCQRTMSSPPRYNSDIEMGIPARRTLSDTYCMTLSPDPKGSVFGELLEIHNSSNLSVGWQSNRLISHHSSSSEEWYTDLNNSHCSPETARYHYDTIRTSENVDVPTTNISQANTEICDESHQKINTNFLLGPSPQETECGPYPVHASSQLCSTLNSPLSVNRRKKCCPSACVIL